MAFSWLVSLNQPHMQVLKFSDQASRKSEFGLLLLEAPSDITYCLVWPGHSMVDQQTRCFLYFSGPCSVTSHWPLKQRQIWFG